MLRWTGYVDGTGLNSVKRAAFVGSPIDHMSGGISREKRSVDYKKIRVN